ncbi:lamin tail domain-containing protein [Streptomyces sp. AK02-01A]|uniref:lamin tail domain-containing protein n=1 Tax=Streptomyces sp. AK02-01A TaxID=3028648 RepID=UPI0029B68F76|nr:lamin tail domain-containing protein [Streptomyces sp. AK02-01A]MDX3850787.1 lamin tail domain-containing protein [Streptomyces sp. AK02-01A]
MFSSASRSVAVALGSAALVATAVLPATAAGPSSAPRPHRSPVVLGQIQYDSPGREDGSNRSLNGEWVTVSNTGWDAVNLRGWTLSDDSRRVYRFKNLRLAGKQSVRVRTGIGRDTSRDVYQDGRRYVWDNRDTATLRDDRGRVVDSKRWGHRHH